MIILDEALRAVRDYADRKRAVWFDQSVLDRGSYWFFHVGFIGSLGVIVDRADGRLYAMGYLLRPPFAHDAVTALPGGRVRVSFKAPWRSGTAHADMDAHQFLARLCALVPPPGFHMTRYYGVFASHHRLRERVIPKPAAPPPPPQLALDFALADDSPSSSPSSSPRPRRIAWAKLLARIFALDITRCRKCGGRMRVLEVVSDPDAIARILHGARAPPAPPPPGHLLLLP
jgi:hypothetical protein